MPDLVFGPDVSASGFTPAGISAFSDLRPSAIIRELIQNSLDAALIEANEPCAIIRFRKFSCDVSDIPGIESYRKAFQQAINTQTLSGKREMPSQARLVVERIGVALNKQKQTVLSVTDNGIGLNEQRMSALLSDGVSAKSENAAGTYGNGHSVAIPASDFRYILYGGVIKKGVTLAAGHAVLASHRLPEDEHGRSAHGLYIESFDSPAEDIPYTFVRDLAVPPLIATEIDHIQCMYGHGTAVIIPAFNHFEDEDALWNIVSRAAACNFFQAIHQDQLVVEVEDHSDIEDEQSSMTDTNTRVLNTKTLPMVLRQYIDEKRIGRRGAFLSGRKANEAYKTLVEGESSTVATSQGDVLVSVLLRNSGRPSVGLCRNGMWITDDLPRFQNYFNDRQPFHAIVFLDPDQRNDFYRLIQEAETPLHNDLALKPMSVARRKALGDALVQIRNWIRDTVPEAKTQSYSPDDVLTIQFNDADAQGPGGRQRSFYGIPTATARRSPTRGDRRHISEDGPGLNNKSNSGDSKSDRNKMRRAAAPYFQIASVPIDKNKQRIQVECEHNCDNAELRMFVDENIDATCDRQLPSQVTPLHLSNIRVNGKRINKKNLIKENENTIGIDLGNLSANSSSIIETSYVIPNEVMRVMPGHNPALRIEIASRVDAVQPVSSKSKKSKTNSDA